MLTYARQEKHEQAAVQTGRLVAKVPLQDEGRLDAVVGLLGASHGSPLRRGIISAILSHNHDQQRIYQALHEIARSDKDQDLQVAAIRILWSAAEAQHEANCKLWLELAGADDDIISGEAAHMCAKWKTRDGCTVQWDALLDLIEKRGKAGRMQQTGMVVAIKELHQQDKATAAQKKRILEIAKAIAERGENADIARSFAQELLEEHDPAAKAAQGGRP